MAAINWITIETILKYILQIKEKAFGLKAAPTLNEWHLRYFGYYITFDVHLTITEDWVYFQVPLLKPEIKIHPQCRSALFYYLLRLNGMIHFVKLTLGPDDRLLLVMEIPSELFNFNSFRNTIEGFTTYLDRFAPEISIIAQQPEFARYIETGKWTKREDTIEIDVIKKIKKNI